MAKNTGNDGKGNNALRDEWETPQELFDILSGQYEFNFDCCANQGNSKCKEWANNFELFQDNCLNNSICWMNPPFSIAWKMFEHFFKEVKKGIAIYRVDNLETGIWQKVILPNCDWIFIPKGRISYEGIDGQGARFPSALIGIGVDIPKEIEGTTLSIYPLTQQFKGGNGIHPQA